MAEHRDDGPGHERRPPRAAEGYDEAAEGGRGVPPSHVGTTPYHHRGPEDAFDRGAREAADDVRRRDSSAD